MAVGAAKGPSDGQAQLLDFALGEVRRNLRIVKSREPPGLNDSSPIITQHYVERLDTAP